MEFSKKSDSYAAFPGNTNRTGSFHGQMAVPMQENTKTDTLTVLAHTRGPMGINMWGFGLAARGTDWGFIPAEMDLFMLGILWTTFLKEMVPPSISKEILIPANGNLASRMVKVA